MYLLYVIGKLWVALSVKKTEKRSIIYDKFSSYKAELFLKTLKNKGYLTSLSPL